MEHIQRIKSGKQQFAVIVGYLGILILVAMLFAPIIPNGSYYTSAFDQILDLNFGGDYMRELSGIEELDTITDLEVIVVVIISAIVVPISIKRLRKRLPKNTTKFGFESEEDYTKRLIKYTNEWYYRNLYGTNTIACLRCCTTPLLVFTFILTAFSLIVENTQGNMDGNIRAIIAFVVFCVICLIPPENIILAKEKKMIVEGNMFYDTTLLTLRERTIAELEQQKNALYNELGQQKTLNQNQPANPDTQNNHNQDVNINTQTTEKDNIQLLKEYKDLLDSGIISQEEFDAKKQELLNMSNNK